MAKHSVREELQGVLALVGLIWCISLLGFVLPRLESYGVTPRTLRGLVGIVAAPFLHADWAHLVANTIPLTVLLLLLAGSRAEFWRIITLVTLLGGALLWMFGRSANHIGASGLIYGLITFLIFSGIWERRFIPMIVAIAVAFLYGGVLLSGIVPSFGSHVSWDGHLFGAIAGGIVAYTLIKVRRGSEARESGSFMHS